MPEKAIKVRVFGRVQGVGYRSWTSSNAQKYGLINLWVKKHSLFYLLCVAYGLNQLHKEVSLLIVCFLKSQHQKHAFL